MLFEASGRLPVGEGGLVVDPVRTPRSRVHGSGDCIGQ